MKKQLLRLSTLCLLFIFGMTQQAFADDFVDFEITNEQLSGEFDPSTLPAGVTFEGTKRGDSHGYGNVTIKVPVTGKVTFTIGGCRYER